jgi:predicted DNA-binding transcriptional regulator YafY
MSRLKVHAKTFERPRDFNGREHLRRSFGVWTVANDRSHHLVRVELRGYAAQLAQERRWHPTQDLMRLNEKGTKVEVRFEVGRLEEVLRWVLSFGRQAKVLGPPDLVRMVKDELKAMSAS